MNSSLPLRVYLHNIVSLRGPQGQRKTALIRPGLYLWLLSAGPLSATLFHQVQLTKAM